MGDWSCVQVLEDVLEVEILLLGNSSKQIFLFLFWATLKCYVVWKTIRDASLVMLHLYSGCFVMHFQAVLTG